MDSEWEFHRSSQKMSGSAVNPQKMLEDLESLREWSLIYSDESGGEMRFRMLETLREYAAGCLTPRDRAALQQNHAAYYSDLTASIDFKLDGPQQAEWLKRLPAEAPNLQAALEYLSSSGPSGMGLQLALALGKLLRRTGQWMEGRRVLQEGLKQARAAGSQRLEAAALCELARVSHDLGHLEEVQQQAGECLALYRALGDSEGAAGALNLLGIVALDQKDWKAARASLEDALDLYGTSHPHGRSMALHNLGKLASLQGNLDQARILYEEALSYRKASGDLHKQAETLGNLGALAFRQGDYPGARRLYLESLSHHQQLHDRYGIGIMLYNLAEVAQHDSNLQAAVLLFIHSERLFRELLSSDLPYPTEALQRLREEMGDEAFAEARQTAERVGWEDAVQEVDR